MRIFLRAHWKAIVAIILLVVLALFTVTPGAAVSAPSLALRLHGHVGALAGGHAAATPAGPEDAIRYIEKVLRDQGYAVRRQAYNANGQKVRNIEASVANLAPHGKPVRTFIVGAHYDPAAGLFADAANGSGTAAVLELARLLKDMHPSQGTEVKFVFVVNEEAPWLRGELQGELRGELREPEDGVPALEGAPAPARTGWYRQRRHGHMLPGTEGDAPQAGNFIAYAGTQASSRQVLEALSAFRPASDFAVHGLAAPAYVQGVTFSAQAADAHPGAAAIMVTRTGFLRYPYYQTNQTDQATDSGMAVDTPDRIDYDGTARVVEGLARTLTALAAATQG